VLFAVPWQGRIVLGTTDTPVPTATLEPRAQEAEIDFLLRTAAQYLTRAPTRADVRSIFVGLRPLAASAAGSTKTKEVSRRHKIVASASGLITITGGKWTTYRRMGQDTIDQAIKLHQLPAAASHTAKLDSAFEFLLAEVVWAARHELARTVEDVLARRVRLLFLDAAAAIRAAPTVAALLVQELGHDAAWQAGQVAAFAELARGYQLAS
jgi:glycerol-3-phosphate dehydrogenase